MEPKRKEIGYWPTKLILSTEITGKVIQMKILDFFNDRKELVTATGDLDDPKCAQKVEDFLLKHDFPVAKAVELLEWIKAQIKE